MNYQVFNTDMGPDPVTVGVAFAGGGVRSFTEIVALRDMQEKGLPVTAVSGTSMGSALAALLACGLEIKEIEQILIDSEAGMVEMGLFKPNVRMLFPKSSGAAGMVDVSSISSFFSKVFERIGIVQVSELLLPAAFVSVDLKTMKPLIFSNAPAWFNGMDEVEFYEKDIAIADAIAASCAFPLAISAVSLDDYLLVDGGVRLNVPTPIFNRQLIDLVVALSASPNKRTMGNARSALNIGLRSVDCMSHQLELFQHQLADISISTPAEAEVFDWGKGTTLLAAADAYLRMHPQNYQPYFDIVKEREEDWEFEKEEIRQRQEQEKLQKEQARLAEMKGLRGMMKRFMGKTK